ncbi:peptidoglycan-recognition protein SC2 isoform X10 [Leptinotarsa decemlineata]|uniref:peptidoglycan-recognition protein SC2 isoform X10 n=1 Tax=Leptinotarsa decemlineata TaxID=7539 RepID=UPI003D309603
MTVDKFKCNECSEDCKHLKSLYLLSSQLDEFNKLLSHQKKSIEEQQVSIKLLLAKLPRTEKTEEQEHIDVNKRKTLIKAFLWLLLALFLLLMGTIIVIFVLNKPEDKYVQPSIAQNNHIGSHQLFVRSDWGARPPKHYTNITGPVHMVIIKHTAGGYCDNFVACSKIVSDLQSLSATNGWPDIYCNFLISGDGNIFEGRGWGVQPQERNNTVDIVFIGNYVIDEMNSLMIDAAKALLKDGVEKKYLDDDYIVVCHNQTKNTMSPGQNVVKEVQKWDHFDRNLHFKHQL